MRKIIFIIFIFSFVSVISGQNYYLNINLKNGDNISYAIDDINKIDFDNITSIKDVQKLQRVIQSFKLMQNYPNPFNPSTTISYQIPQMSKVKVNIFDLNGKLINTILNETQEKGLYKIDWNGKNKFSKKVASGIYIYSVHTDKSILSKKMILLK